MSSQAGGSPLSFQILADGAALHSFRGELYGRLDSTLHGDQLEQFVLAAHEAAAMLILHATNGGTDGSIEVAIVVADDVVAIELVTVSSNGFAPVPANGSNRPPITGGTARVTLDRHDNRTTLQLTVQR